MSPSEPLTHVQVVEIRPEPTAAVRDAIARALDEVWPIPGADWKPTDAEFRWRVAERPWLSKQIPLRRWSR